MRRAAPMTVAPHCAIFLLFSVATTAPAFATDVFRCLSPSGATEYRDEPCTPETDEGFVMHTRDTSVVERAAAQSELREIRELSREIDQRTNERIIATRLANEARERELAQRVAEEPAAASEAPYFWYPYGVDSCSGKRSLCGQAKRPHHKLAQMARAAPAIIQRTHQRRALR